MDKDTKADAVRLLISTKEILTNMGWSRSRYVERNEDYEPVAFELVAALQQATIRGEFKKQAYDLAKAQLEASVRPLTLTSFNRMAKDVGAVLARIDVAIQRVGDMPELKSIVNCKVVSIFSRSKAQ